MLCRPKASRLVRPPVCFCFPLRLTFPVLISDLSLVCSGISPVALTLHMRDCSPKRASERGRPFAPLPVLPHAAAGSCRLRCPCRRHCCGISLLDQSLCCSEIHHDSAMCVDTFLCVVGRREGAMASRLWAELHPPVTFACARWHATTSSLAPRYWEETLLWGDSE